MNISPDVLIRFLSMYFFEVAMFLLSAAIIFPVIKIIYLVFKTIIIGILISIKILPKDYIDINKLDKQLKEAHPDNKIRKIFAFSSIFLILLSLAHYSWGKYIDVPQIGFIGGGSVGSNYGVDKTGREDFIKRFDHNEKYKDITSAPFDSFIRRLVFSEETEKVVIRIDSDNPSNPDNDKMIKNVIRTQLSLPYVYEFRSFLISEPILISSHKKYDGWFNSHLEKEYQNPSNLIRANVFRENVKTFKDLLVGFGFQELQVYTDGRRLFIVDLTKTSSVPTDEEVASWK